MSLPYITNRKTGAVVDLEAFAQRWMAGTMTEADERLWDELVTVTSICQAVLVRVGYSTVGHAHLLGL